MEPTDLSFGLTEVQRKRGNFPELPVVNMLAEQVSTENGVSLQSRPPLVTGSITMGSGPVKSLFSIDGVLSGSLFGVSGTSLYEEATNRGTVTGSGYSSLAGYEDILFVNAGEDIHSWDGSTFSSLTFPDSADVIKIVVGASRLVAIRKDTAKIYWSGILNTTIDALNFATAENEPDRLVDMLYIGDRLVLFGSKTVEFWPATGDSDLPFAPLPGATFQIGCKATGLAQEFNRGFIWITSNNEVCVNDQNNIVSSSDLQVAISKSTNTQLFTFYIDGNEFAAIKLDNETWVYSSRTGVWSTFESYGETNWVCQCYENGYFGSTKDGVLLQWGETNHLDLEGPLERRVRAWQPLTSEPFNVGNIQVKANTGHTPFITGEYADPVVELRTSKDGGRTWQNWKAKSMGAQGSYRTRLVWGSMGLFGFPGLMVEIRNSDPVDFRLSRISCNHPLGGI